MKRHEAEHVLRAASAIAQENSFFIVGSQAVLFLLDFPPQELLLSRELDLYPALSPEKADLIDGAIGAMSSFDATFGYHADGVGPETAVMPLDWRTREKLIYIENITAICPEIHDLAISKCVAGREKDADFIRIMFKHDLIDLQILSSRISNLDSHLPIPSIIAWAKRRFQEAKE